MKLLNVDFMIQTHRMMHLLQIAHQMKKYHLMKHRNGTTIQPLHQPKNLNLNYYQIGRKFDRNATVDQPHHRNIGGNRADAIPNFINYNTE